MKQWPSMFDRSLKSLHARNDLLSHVEQLTHVLWDQFFHQIWVSKKVRNQAEVIPFLVSAQIWSMIVLSFCPDFPLGKTSGQQQQNPFRQKKRISNNNNNKNNNLLIPMNVSSLSFILLSSFISLSLHQQEFGFKVAQGKERWDEEELLDHPWVHNVSEKGDYWWLLLTQFKPAILAKIVLPNQMSRGGRENEEDPSYSPWYLVEPAPPDWSRKIKNDIAGLHIKELLSISGSNVNFVSHNKTIK